MQNPPVDQGAPAPFAFIEDIDRELLAIACLLAAAGVGGWRHAPALALFGALGALTVFVLYLWWRRCLVRLTYTRRLGQHRAEFGETAVLECRLVNDKLLPLPWVRTADVVPDGLDFVGVTVRERPEEGDRALLQAYALLPFQASTRRIEVRCERRGRHHFGHSEVRSGDPLGLRDRTAEVDNDEDLVVYPKIFPLPPLLLGARAPIGEERARSVLFADPSRVAGMRAYHPGDPLRHVDWRATARSGELLVRNFEPTTTPRVALFFDVPRAPGPEGADEMEFTLSLAASVLVHLGDRGLPVGCYAPGLADDDPVEHEPSSAPGALGAMLELLALCRPDPGRSLAGLLNARARRLPRQALVVVVASRFTPGLLVAIAECRRRAPVSALAIEQSGLPGPPDGVFDRLYRVARPVDWQHADALQLAD